MAVIGQAFFVWLANPFIDVDAAGYNRTGAV